MVMSAPSGWRCVIVPPPNPLAAVGGALRHAFPVEGRFASLAAFEPWLSRLGTSPDWSSPGARRAGAGR